MSTEYLDRLPPDWFVLAVMREGQRGWDWVALVIDVDPDDLKNCQCDFPALFWVDPKLYKPEPRKAHQGWLRIPGKYQSRAAACDALEDLMATRH